jgi:hypothetical protein
MKTCPSREVASYAATQELHDILRNPKVHYRVRKSPPLDFIRSQINPVLTTPSYTSNSIPCGLSPREKYTERPPLVGEVNANVCGQRVPYTSNIHLNIIHTRFGLPSNPFPSGCPTNNLHSFLFSPVKIYPLLISSSLI